MRNHHLKIQSNQHDCGTAIPSVSEIDIPNTEEDVSLLQKTPKSNPFPAKPTVESAIFAFSTLAKYAYQLPSVA